MQHTFLADTLPNIPAKTLICFVAKFDKIANHTLRLLNDVTGQAVSTLLKSKEFTGEEGETATLYRPVGFKAERVLLVGIGSDTGSSPDGYRRAMGDASRHKGVARSRKVAVCFEKLDDPTAYQAAAEGYHLGAYQLLDFKTGEEAKEKSSVNELMFTVDIPRNLKKLERAVTRGVTIAEGQLLARRLTQAPSNRLTPRMYAQKAQDLAREHGLSCRVLDEQAIAREKMGSLQAVARGSSEPARFIILQYGGGPKGQKPIVLVGKGITFDSGGISLKPAKDMADMKQDMGGSAVVLATLVTASRLGIKRNLVGLIPAAENMPSGNAVRPGDIIKSRKGKTVEIINTDSEGRLILADALDYANKFDPQAVIDIATLTGACLYVLGYAGAPMTGNNSTLMDQLRAASAVTAERVWEMPIWDDFRNQMKSTIADLVNSGGRPAGTLAAAAFLENFIGDWPWAHIDIAYMDLEPKGKPYSPKGATGFGVRLLVELLSKWKKV